MPDHKNRWHPELDPLGVETRIKRMDTILDQILKSGWNLGSFLEDMFMETQRGDPRNKVYRRNTMISTFLGGSESVTAEYVAELMYSHPAGHLVMSRGSNNRTAEEAANEKKQRKGDNLQYMSRNCLREWAIGKVEDIVEEEAAMVSSKDGGFHLPSKQASWDFILNFSMGNALRLIEEHGPILLRLLVAAAYSKAERPRPQVINVADLPTSGRVEALPGQHVNTRSGDRAAATHGDGVAAMQGDRAAPTDGDQAVVRDDNQAAARDCNEAAASDGHEMATGDGDETVVRESDRGASSGDGRTKSPSADARVSYAAHLENVAPKGTGQNRVDPFMIIMAAYLILMNARNMRFTLFQKVVAVWLFANNAAYEIFVILARLGLSVSYTTLLDLLRSISKSAQETVRSKARFRAFLLIYDNINRMIRAWDPDLGQKDIIQNGTAATFVVLEDCDVEAAFNVKALQDARSEGRRRELNVNGLYKRVDWADMDAIMSTHCLGMLIDSVDSLDEHSRFVNQQLKGPLAKHRMREGRVTDIHPLATSDFNEGNTAENAKVLDDLLLRQLGLPKEEVERLLVIVGGDQSTVEKLRTLRKFLDSCPHGYSRYGWVLPLIQLWHMGWADLERILSTHWGTSHADDLSSLGSANVLLGRKVKQTKRPDYYPALHLVFDTLTADVLNCWRTYLGTDDLNQYFKEQPATIDELQVMASAISARYLTTKAYKHALAGGEYAEEFFKHGKPWNRAHRSSEDASNEGDQVLANTILRMRDSMWHYEFQHAIADGDIGRAMNIMAVWTFTFTGCGKNKYTNELLELACNFEYEYSSELKKAVLNNWLCNLTGYPGCWFPMDLLQEKNIKQLKKMSQRRDARFGGNFYKEIIALNIRGFLLSKQSIRSLVGLGARGGSHRRTLKEAAMRTLLSKMHECELHHFRAGRKVAHVAKDDLTSGYRVLAQTSRIRDFVNRTIRDAGDLHAVDDDPESAAPADDDEDQLGSILPNMMVDGRLILGDELEQEEDDGDFIIFGSGTEEVGGLDDGELSE